jgi:FtsZ-interacting cell division protein ZipA
MKINVDTILYVVIMIAILVISGLGSRRKKKLLQMQPPASPGSTGDDTQPEKTGPASRDAFDQFRSRFATGPQSTPKPGTSPSRQTAMDPFQRLEQFITGQQPEIESMEGESLETIVDEEEMIMEEIHKSREETPIQPPSGTVDEEPMQITKPETIDLTGLFEGKDKIKKAIIYSEILKRRYE